LHCLDPFQEPICLRSLFLIAALTIAGRTFSAVPSENTASWPRWLQSGSSPVVFSLRRLAGLPDASVSSAIGDSDATQSLLAWTEQTLRLIQTYRQNPQRAARALALVHAVMHDAFVLAARDSGSATAGLAAAHRAVSLTLAYLYPYESVGWIESKGLALSHTWAGAQCVASARLERASARRASRRGRDPPSAH
jgi:hypothetical protein